MILRIILLLVFLSTIVSAIEITEITCPETISINQDFICKLNINEVNGLYDIKIQIKGGNQTINKIWNNEWQRSDWYVTKLIDKSDEYDIKLLIDKDFSGTANALIRMRETGTKQYILEEIFELEVVELIEDIIESVVESEEDIEDSEKSQTKIKYSEVEDIPIESNKKVSPIRLNEKSTNTTIYQKVIKLNSDEIIEEIVYESKNEKIKRYSFYLFIPFLIIVLILLLFKKW